jgi:hypothetical protein
MKTNACHAGSGTAARRASAPAPSPWRICARVMNDSAADAAVGGRSPGVQSRSAASARSGTPSARPLGPMLAMRAKAIARS